ncbi:hypothetical protein SMC26_35565 [Actinomadura fulvescens]|uniref:hypothetical protein n=1 Tax=Actinomadura fulvescens TaxID=46160 RepID=UPI0031DA067B
MAILVRLAGQAPTVDRLTAIVAERWAGLPRLRLSVEHRFGRAPRWRWGTPST